MVGAIFSLPRTELKSIISPAFNSLSHYVQPPNSGQRHRLRLYVSARTRRHQSNCPTLAIASRIGSLDKQLLKLASTVLSQDRCLASFCHCQQQPQIISLILYANICLLLFT